MKNFEKIYKRISNVFRLPIKLHEPYVSKGKTLSIIKSSIEKNQISAVGKHVKKFEDLLKKFTKSKNIISLCNGTSALYASLICLGVKKNDEVLIPAFNFIASTNAIVASGAIPHFVDIELKTFGIDPVRLDEYLLKITYKKNNFTFNKRTGRRIKFIIPTHVFGHICEINDLKKICKKYNLKLIEDASEALGSFLNKKHAGTFGNLGVLSFNGNKIVTTGGGGAIICNNFRLAKKIRHFISNAKTQHSWRSMHDQIGFNFRMPNINAALAINQMMELKSTLKKKRLIYKIYEKIFRDIKNIYLYREEKQRRSNYWLQTLVFKKHKYNSSKILISYLRKKKIECRSAWCSMTKLNHLKLYPRMNCKNSELMEQKVVNIPSGPILIDKMY